MKSDILTKFIIHKPLNCSSKNAVYLILQNFINVGNNILPVPKSSFVIGLTIIKVVTVNLRTKNKLSKKQKIFHEHFCSDDHNGIQEWVITSIEHVDDVKLLTQSEHFWAHKLETLYLNGLNQRDIYAAY